MKRDHDKQTAAAARSDRVREALRDVLAEARHDFKDVDRAGGWGRNYFSAVMRGQVKFRVDHLLIALEVAEMSPVEFFQLLDGREASTGSTMSPSWDEIEAVVQRIVNDRFRKAAQDATDDGDAGVKNHG